MGSFKNNFQSCDCSSCLIFLRNFINPRFKISDIKYTAQYYLVPDHSNSIRKHTAVELKKLGERYCEILPYIY